MSTILKPRRIGAVGALSVAVSGVLLSATPALAAVYSSANFQSSTYAGDGTQGCTVSSTSTGTSPSTTPITTDGGPASHTVSLHSVSTDGDGGTATQDMSDTTTANLTSSGTNVAAMQFGSTGSVQVDTSGAPTCTPTGNAVNQVRFAFTVTTAGYLNLDTKVHGPEYAEIEIQADNGNNSDDVYFDWEAEYTDVSSTHSVYLPAGNYSGYYYSEPYRNTNTVGTGGTTSASVNATFTPDGTPAKPAPTTSNYIKGALATPSIGKGLGYTSLPLVRSCATNALVENVTSNKKTAKTIKRVSVFIDGHRALSVKRPKAGRALIVPVAENGKVRTVRTRVVTATGPKHHQKISVYKSLATYHSCN